MTGIRLTPLNQAIGAEIGGVDLTEPLDDTFYLVGHMAKPDCRRQTL